MSVKNKINESLPKEQRLGQVGINTKGEKMIISEYNREKDIEVMFLHNWQKIRTSYSHFLEGNVKNPLYYKEKYEGQIRISNQRQWMRLLVYNDRLSCVVEFEDGTLVDCHYGNFTKGNIHNPNYTKPSENEFYYNDKLNCWVGITNKGEEFLFSHPDEKIVEEVKKYTWYINQDGYVFNTAIGDFLHKIIKQISKQLREQGYYMIDHINNNPLDNRYDNLRYSNAKENSKNKKPIGESGITGLIKSKSEKWHGQCRKVRTISYIDKNEALIDLLIMQRLLNYTHNEHLFYMLDNVSQERIDFVENYIKEKIEKQKNVKHTITCRNTFEKIDDSTYKMYDTKGESGIINANDIEKIKLGNWSYELNCRKRYCKGSIIYNNSNKTIKLHRFLLNLMNEEYSRFIVDHLDGNERNNETNNLLITDIAGNNINMVNSRGYKIIDDGKAIKYVVYVKLGEDYNKSKGVTRTFRDEKQAKKFYLNYKKYLMNGRLQWKTKEELDKWLEDVKNSGLDIDEVIKQHYAKLYMSLKHLIEEFDCDRSGSFLMQ